jgi:hypothetical protein
VEASAEALDEKAPVVAVLAKECSSLRSEHVTMTGISRTASQPFIAAMKRSSAIALDKLLLTCEGTDADLGHAWCGLR